MIGAPIHSLRLGAFGLGFMPFELYWQLLTLRMFQVRVVRLSWENFVTIVYDYGCINIIGLFVEEVNPWTGKNPFHFGADAFGVSIKTVKESLQYYWDNISDRESLPSWDDTDEIFEII